MISNNVAGGINGFGGGLALQPGATAQNCLITENSALDGGGVFCEKGGIVRNCTIESNTATSIGGGGIFMEEGGWMADSIVEGNIATNQYARAGGGLFFYNPGGKVNSSTIAGNLGVAATFPDSGGGGIGTRRSDFRDRRSIGELSHSVIWGNMPVATSEDWTGTGNVYANPATVTSASGADLSISTASTNSTILTTLYKYDLNSNLRLRSLPNGTTEERSFNALNRLQSISISSLSSLSSFAATYKHDPVGNLRQMSDTVSSLHTIPQSVVYDWTYDDAYRLESETCTAGGSPARSTEFDWDDAGNRTAMRKYSGGSLASTTTYSTPSSLNQMTGWTCGQTNAVYSYDLNGARTSKTVTVSAAPSSVETTAYSYDEDNRLVGVDVINNAGETNSWSFGYDYRTRRISRETPTEKTLHVFDGGLSVQEYDISTSATPSINNLSTESIRGEGMGCGVGGMVYSICNGQLKASHSNHRGDIVAKTDSLGNLSWFARYNAYGTRFHEVGATHDRQRGNTKDEEEPLGLSNQGIRWTDIIHGVFLTLDPIGFADGPNRYCFVRGNPINAFDALGLTLEYLTPRAEQIVNHILEHGSDQNEAEFQTLIDSDHEFTMTTTETQFNGQNTFTPTDPDAAKEQGKGSGGHISIEVGNPPTEFSIASSAAHEVHHAHEAAKGEITGREPGEPGFDTNGNGIEDNEDRAVQAQRSYQKANGVEDDDLREDWHDAHKGLSDKGFLKKMYPDRDIDPGIAKEEPSQDRSDTETVQPEVETTDEE